MTENKTINSSKPYLIRAIYEWIVDNDLTPYLVVDAKAPHVQVPEAYIEDDSIILNIAPKACRGLLLGNDRIVFSARFGGEALQIFVPPSAVSAIYAKENGQGMILSGDDIPATESDGGDTATEKQPTYTATNKGKTKGNKPHLTIIKN